MHQNRENMRVYAHSLEGKSPEHWQPLEEHLNNVAHLATEFAKPFGGDQWAYLAGLWHDLGKYSNEFQAMLLRENGIEAHIETVPGRVIHSEAGGHHATLKGWKGADRLLSWLVMGHHAGLADYQSDANGARALSVRMRNPERSETLLQSVPAHLLNQEPPRQAPPKDASIAFYIRMLFSCLVDADFLDTEAFMNAANARLRGNYPTLKNLLPPFEQHMDAICRNAPATQVNSIRREILEQCRRKAEDNPAAFSLTVPTGGGKTLASMAFALRHALKHDKDRIIYVIPFTSIIEQTAAVFRSIPGFEKAVIEHHSNIAETDETRETSRHRLAAENWDAPIVVTTSVQFFESLFAAKTSRCRKLHNIANSIVIFDEAQCLPPEYIRPITFAIRELQKHYRVTPVLCTATQPVLTKTHGNDFDFKEGFDHVTEIVENPDELVKQLKRVEIAVLNQPLKPINLDQLAEALLLEKEPTLCILNRKDDARQLARKLPTGTTMHLSTNMCAEHRSAVLETIRHRLNKPGSPLFVISTSLVEAGVDIDFPVVYRALAGLDSIAQAAGRCNREGKLFPAMGKTIVFLPEEQPRYVKNAAQIAQALLEEDASDIFARQTLEDYFKTRFWLLGADRLDQYRILERLAGLQPYFRSAADDFRLIRDDWTRAVIAPYGNAQAIVDEMLENPSKPPRLFLRQLQRFTINIHQFLFQKMLDQDDIHPIPDLPGILKLNPLFYDNNYGFIPPEEINYADPEQNIV